jgi:hypothetical protein
MSCRCLIIRFELVTSKSSILVDVSQLATHRTSDRPLIPVFQHMNVSYAHHTIVQRQNKPIALAHILLD